MRTLVTRFLGCFAAALILLGASPASAREVRVPIVLDDEFLRQGLVRQVYTDAGGTLRAFEDEAGCNDLTLSEPQVDQADGKLRVRSRAVAHLATPVFGSCLLPIEWRGILELLERVEVDPALPIVRFRVVDANLLAESGEKDLAGDVWDLAKSSVLPRLEAFELDLRAAFSELSAVLPLVLPEDDAAWTESVVSSLRLAEVAVADDGLRGTLAFDVPQRAQQAPPPPAPEPALTPAELARWEQSWQQWDAFLVYLVKRAALDADPAHAEELREALFDVLVDARLDLLEALAPAAPGQPDPVRALFVKTWERLAPVMKRMMSALPGQSALQYLSFVAAGDALKGLDELGPESPLDLSADGLRRLARVVGPGDDVDPLVYSLDVDPQLRTLFGFGPPIEPPEDYPEDTVASRLLELLVASAWAAESPEAPLAKKLHLWVPSLGDLDRYLPVMRDLLRSVATRNLDGAKLDSPVAEVYRRMVLATAWQESCWRQWVKDGAQVKPIQSPVGSVGLMQINKNVWRGVYDVAGLGKDVAYNARAGADILLHYLRDYAVKKGEHTATGSTDNLARSTYAIYNGGPRHMKRYRDPKERADLKKIDALFWSKYLAVKGGQEMKVAECLGAPSP